MGFLVAHVADTQPVHFFDCLGLDLAAMLKASLLLPPPRETSPTAKRRRLKGPGCSAINPLVLT